MQAYYAFGSGINASNPVPASVAARAASWGGQPMSGEPTGGDITVYPAVVVVSTAIAAVVIADNTGQATLAEVQSAENAATTAEAAVASALATAQTAIAAMPSQMGAYQTQIQTDLASVSTWATLTASEQAAIMGRILQGFATMMDVLYSQAIVTHMIHP